MISLVHLTYGMFGHCEYGLFLAFLLIFQDIRKIDNIIEKFGSQI